MTTTPQASAQPGELLDDMAPLSLEDLARICHMAPTWVSERLETGLLQAEGQGGHWRFASASIVRARRLAHLETTFDADPHLAALTTDLIEEVAQLRQRLQHLEAALGTPVPPR
ncbi:MerR family transcriptional regulator [Acidovorax delafieldii 2AN]|uniref:MerR family transcriptional regulator n=1 Tax=Acidovorax delafieldii 2AN TaxID=573060 RepID=C5SZZ9_ACIDE|nr:chaperone modulator CbpM [Acidovorax delafieldii]EER62315.1 MerR family transcriptional regulator [Acidovorax delafieldii 2AN]